MRTEVDEDDIKLGLLGTEQEREDAIRKAYERFKYPLASFIRERVAPTLDSDELANAVHDAFRGLARYVSSGAFNPDGSLATLLFAIGRRKAIDQLRRRRRTLPEGLLEDGFQDDSEDETEKDEFNSTVAQILRESPEVGALWKTAADISAANEIMRQFRLWIGSQPRLQRKVGEALLRHFGDISDADIAEEISTSINRVPVASVKSALREITRKFKTLIENTERIRTS